MPHSVAARHDTDQLLSRPRPPSRRTWWASTLTPGARDPAENWWARAPRLRSPLRRRTCDRLSIACARSRPSVRCGCAKRAQKLRRAFPVISARGVSQSRSSRLSWIQQRLSSRSSAPALSASGCKPRSVSWSH